MAGRRAFLTALLSLVAVPRRVPYREWYMSGHYVDFGRASALLLHGRQKVVLAGMHADFASWKSAVDSATTQLHVFRTEAAKVENSLKRAADCFQRGIHG